MGPQQWRMGVGLIPIVDPVDSTKSTSSPVSQDQPTLPLTKRQKGHTVDTTVNVMSLVRQRLKFLRAEIRRLKALEKEKEELERLISAAKGKSRGGVVRELKRSVS